VKKAVVALALAVLAAVLASGRTADVPRLAVVEERAFVHTLRLSGVLSATRAKAIAAPRLVGPDAGALLVTALATAGQRVTQGDLLAEFDAEAQRKTALDKKAEYLDLVQQLKRRQAEQDSQRAQDETEMRRAQSAYEAARLELRKNDALPRLEAERNQQSFDEAAARLAQLQKSQDGKARLARLDLEILETRERWARDVQENAEANLERLRLRAPIDGMVLLTPVYKQELRTIVPGDQLQPGETFMQVVDPTEMYVRARVNQADVALLSVGQKAYVRVEVRVEAYAELVIPGRVMEISPIASGQQGHRSFDVRVHIDSRDPRLLPDLSAAVDVLLLRIEKALVVPRDAVRLGTGGPAVYVSERFGTRLRAVTLGARSDTEAVVTSGLTPGENVVRHVEAGGDGT
jgi:HlyD family secretion protein